MANLGSTYRERGNLSGRIAPSDCSVSMSGGIFLTHVEGSSPLQAVQIDLGCTGKVTEEVREQERASKKHSSVVSVSVPAFRLHP